MVEVALVHDEESILVDQSVLVMHCPVFVKLLADCHADSREQIPMIVDTLRGLKPCVILCNFKPRAEDVPSAICITPHLLAETLPVIHKYGAVGLEKNR